MRNSKLTSFSYLTLLLIITVFTFLPTFNNVFTNWDDQLQVTQNADILEFSFKSIQKIFSSFYVGMYQPITTLCFTITNFIFGLNAAAYHFVSLLCHLINILLVFWLMNLITKKKDMVVIVTSLFAIHPMFVEAIAWVSATSTLIYSGFYLGALISYLYYLNSSKKKFLFFTFLLFLISLLSKVMAITLPIVLLLLDFYKSRKLLSKKVITEKIPFFILAIIFGVIAILGRQMAGHLTNTFTLFDKLFIMMYQIIWYLFKFILPIELSTFYPNPKKINGFLPTIYYLSPVIMVFIGLITLKFKKYWKKISFSFLLFLIPISLTLKVVQVGNQITTDRYTYIPYLGLLLLFTFGYEFLIAKKPKLKPYLIALITALFIVFSTLSFQRTKVWKNSASLWTDVVKKDETVALAHTNLGVTFVGKDNLKAEKCFLKSIEMDSTFVIPYNNLGFIYLTNNKKKAEEYLFKAIKVDASYLYIYTNLATLYMKTDKEKAKKYIDIAVSINPNNGYVKQRNKTWNTLWIK
jgi:hypothetical protein